MKIKPANTRQQESIKKTTVSLAIDNNVLEEIKKEAQLNRVSLNSCVNSVLSKHTVFYRHAIKEECLIVPSNMVPVMIEMFDEDKVIEVMKKVGAHDVISIFNNNNIPTTLDNIIKYCFEGIMHWSGNYRYFNHYRDNEDPGNYVCVFDHRYGIKWSRILAAAYSYQIEEMLHSPVSAKVSPNNVLLKIRVGDEIS